MQLKEKWTSENEKLPDHLKRAPPIKPSRLTSNFHWKGQSELHIIHNENKNEGGTLDREKLNESAIQAARGQLLECLQCGRRFDPERLEVHQRSCRPGHSARRVRTTPNPKPLLFFCHFVIVSLLFCSIHKWCQQINKVNHDLSKSLSIVASNENTRKSQIYVVSVPVNATGSASLAVQSKPVVAHLTDPSATSSIYSSSSAHFAMKESANKNNAPSVFVPSKFFRQVKKKINFK